MTGSLANAALAAVAAVVGCQMSVYSSVSERMYTSVRRVLEASRGFGAWTRNRRSDYEPQWLYQFGSDLQRVPTKEVRLILEVVRIGGLLPAAAHPPSCYTAITSAAETPVWRSWSCRNTTSILKMYAFAPSPTVPSLPLRASNRKLPEPSSCCEGRTGSLHPRQGYRDVDRFSSYYAALCDSLFFL